MNFLNINQFWIKILIVFKFVFVIACQKSFQNHIEELDKQGRHMMIKIESPKNHISIATEKIMVSGVAHDKTGIKKIELLVNNIIVKVEGQKNWKIQLKLKMGTNKLVAKLTNNSGQSIYSDSIYIHYFWKKLNVLPQAVSHSSILKKGSNFFIIGGMAEVASNQFVEYNILNNSIAKLDNLNEPVSKSIVFLNETSNIEVISGGQHLLGRNDFSFIIGNYNGHLVKQVYNDVNWTSENIDLKFSVSNEPWCLIDNDIYVIGSLSGKFIVKFDKKLNNYEQTSTSMSIRNDSCLSYDVNNDSYKDLIIFYGGLEIDKNYEYYYGSFVKSIYIYQPYLNVLTYYGEKLHYKRKASNIVRIDNKIYIMGGKGYIDEQEVDVGFLNYIEFLDLESMTSKKLHPMPFKAGYASVGVYDGNIYLFGGTNDSNIALDGIYMYNPSLDSLN